MTKSLPSCEVSLSYELEEGESPEEGLEKCRQAIQTYADTMDAVDTLSEKKRGQGFGRTVQRKSYYQVDPSLRPLLK